MLSRFFRRPRFLTRARAVMASKFGFNADVQYNWRLLGILAAFIPVLQAMHLVAVCTLRHIVR